MAWSSLIGSDAALWLLALSPLLVAVTTALVLLLRVHPDDGASP